MAKPEERNVVRRGSTTSLLISSLSKGRFSALLSLFPETLHMRVSRGEIVRLVSI